MKKYFAIFCLVGVSLLMSSCWPDWEKKPDQVTSRLYKEVKYHFTDNGGYFTAELLSCYGIKNTDNPSTGTIYATVKIICNKSSSLKFFSRLNIGDTFITEHTVYPLIRYPAKPYEKIINMITGEETVLNLEFPDVPSSLLQIGQLDISVIINGYKDYHFIIYQIPFNPQKCQSPEFIKWH